MKAISQILIFAYCMISCTIADENQEEDQGIHMWEEYKVEENCYKFNSYWNYIEL